MSPKSNPTDVLLECCECHYIASEHEFAYGEPPFGFACPKCQANADHLKDHEPMTAKHTPAKERRRLDRERRAAQKKRRKRLEAAAPEMITALEIAQDLTDKWKRSEHGADFHEVDKVLRTAIRKARGDS